MDFVHDQLATGQKIRVLTVVDTFSRFSPVIDPRFSYRAEDVELCRKIGDGVNQAADLISATASIPSLNFIPLTTFGNWF